MPLGKQRDMKVCLEWITKGRYAIKTMAPYISFTANFEAEEWQRCFDRLGCNRSGFSRRIYSDLVLAFPKHFPSVLIENGGAPVVKENDPRDFWMQIGTGPNSPVISPAELEQIRRNLAQKWSLLAAKSLETLALEWLGRDRGKNALEAAMHAPHLIPYALRILNEKRDFPTKPFVPDAPSKCDASLGYVSSSF